MLICKVKNKFITITRCILRDWPRYLLKNPARIRFFPSWFISQFWFEPYHKIPLSSIFEATDWLRKYLTKDMIVFEWGSGGSTLFIADRVKKLICVERYQEWYNKVKKHRTTDNLEIYLVKDKNDFVNFPLEYPDNYFDLMILDGGTSDIDYLKIAEKKVKKNGYLLFNHDSNSLLNGWEKIKFIGLKPCVCEYAITVLWKKLL